MAAELELTGDRRGRRPRDGPWAEADSHSSGTSSAIRSSVSVSADASMRAGRRGGREDLGRPQPLPHGRVPAVDGDQGVAVRLEVGDQAPDASTQPVLLGETVGHGGQARPDAYGVGVPSRALGAAAYGLDRAPRRLLGEERVHDHEVAQLAGERHRLRADRDQPERRPLAQPAAVVEHRPLPRRPVVVEHEPVGPQLPQDADEVAQHGLGDQRLTDRPPVLGRTPTERHRVAALGEGVQRRAHGRGDDRVPHVVVDRGGGDPERRRPPRDRAREHARLLDREPLADHARAQPEPLGVGGLRRRPCVRRPGGG